MTHAGEFLRRYAEKSGIGQREIAARARLSEGHLSKILKGDRKQIREGTLAGLLDALPEEMRGEFLRAYLLDIIPESYHGFVAPSVAKGRVKEEPEPYGADDPFGRLAATVRRAFRSPTREKIVGMLESLAENSAASPDFLRGMELLANLKIK